MKHRFNPVALLAMLTLLGACSSPDNPETQVRRAVAAMEKAAEARDVGDLMELVAQDFRDAYGRGVPELARYVQGYFIANQSIHLLTRIDRLEFPSADEARLRVTVAMVGREAEAASAWNLAADIHDLDVTLRRQDGRWKVTYAQWGGD